MKFTISSLRIPCCLLLLGCATFVSTKSFSQVKDASVIQQALDDELKRNMNELVETGFEKPFYIGYGISDSKSYSIMATMGGLLHSIESRSRSKSVRALIGGYDFNDESLDNNMSSPAESNDIDMPLDNDYFGIRRALWVSTDNVYKSAARQYKKNSATVKDDGKPLSEIPHRTFTKTPIVQLFVEHQPYTFDKSKWENYAREISKVLIAYPDVILSGVVMNFQRGDYYFTNSEGIRARTPEGVTVLQISAQSRSASGEITVDQILHFARTPDQLPTLEKMKTEVKEMADNLMKSSTLGSLEEEYTGPILLEGPAVAEVLSAMLFAPREGLTASNAMPDPKITYRNESSMDSKIGKLVASEFITVKDKSPLKVYKDVDLLGSFELDQDGVAPAAELVLIENGILKNLLNDRTITKPDQTANGHASGPGVVEVSLSQTVNETVLKEKLLEQIKKEGLGFGLILRNYSVGRFNKIFKVTPDGKEELLQSGMLKYLPLKSLKKVIAATATAAAYNLPSRTGVNGVVSYIVPQGLLLEEGSVAPANQPSVKEDNYVSSPVVLK